jgi:hypothetical protein
MTNWPGRPVPDDGRHDQPGTPPPHEQQWPGAQAPGNYRQQWANPSSAPPQGAGMPNAHQQPWTQPQPQGPSAQPWIQQSAAGGPPPGWQPAPPGYGGPPPKSRKRLAIAVAALVVVGIVAVVGFRVLNGEGIAGIGAKQALSPKDTVQQYLEALAAGDAEKALSFGAAQPASADLLTNEILAKQNAKLPLTNIRVLDEDTTGATIGMSSVHVAVNFGTVVDDVELPLKKDGNGVWKLENAAIKIDPPLGADSSKALDSVTVFGKNFDQGSLYLFPGYMEVGSANKNLTVTAEPILLKGLAAYSSSYLDAKVELSDSGRAAVEQELSDAFANCERSRQLNPSGCPTKVASYDAVDAVDGTVSWGKADLSGVTIGDLSQYDMTVQLSGKATMSLSYQTTDGATNRGIASAYVSAEADMTSTPPSLTWR